MPACLLWCVCVCVRCSIARHCLYGFSPIVAMWHLLKHLKLGHAHDCPSFPERVCARSVRGMRLERFHMALFSLLSRLSWHCAFWE